MNPTAIYSKSGKGVQEASGKTSLLQRGDRAVLAAIDGRATLADVAQKIGKPYDAAFQRIIAQLDRDGFIREVTAGTPAAAAARPAAAAPVSRPVSKPLGKPERSLGDLDFSSLGGASKPASRPAAPAAPSKSAMEQTTVLAKAREEAEAKAAAERDKLKKEAEAKARAEMEAQVRTEAEDKLKEQAAARAKAEAEAKAKAAQEAAARQVAEAKAKAEAEARAKFEAEAKVKLEAERRAREELERKLEAERKAREEAERKAKAEVERKAKEAEEKARREAEELRQRQEAERIAREEAERKREEARRQQEEERRQREEEEAARKEAELAAAAAAAAMAKVEAAPGPGDGVTQKAKKRDNFADSLLADLESFTSNDDEEQKAREEADRQAKAEADRKRAELDREIREEAERRRQAEDDEQRLAEEARRAQEDERRRRDAEEIRRKAEAATVAAMAKEGRKHEPKEEEDIPVTDDDLDMTEVEHEEEQLAEAKAKEKAQEKAQEKEKARAAKKEKAEYVAPSRPRRPIKWGKPVTVTLALLLLIGVGAAHIVALDTADYERAASEALGRTVKIGSANLWLFSGLPEIRFANVRVGDARVARVVASGWPGGLFGDKKKFTNVRIEGLSLPQAAIGDALFAKVRADNLSVSSVTIKNLQLPGPATLPKDLFAEAAFDARGTLRTAKVEGPDGLVARLTPKQDGSIDFDVLAGGFTLPIAPQVTLSKFVMRGSATPRGMTISEWGGAIFQGGISGKATVRWSGSWNVDGVVTVRNINAAVFAPALVSSGNADGTAKFSMSAADPAGLVAGSRLDGTFTVSQGTLGSVDLARYIQSGGRTGAGVTQFVEMNGQATYDRGTVALRNVNIGAGRLNAGASADIASSGALSGRIVADMKTEKEIQRVTLLLGGTVKEPQVRN